MSRSLRVLQAIKIGQLVPTLIAELHELEFLMEAETSKSLHGEAYEDFIEYELKTQFTDVLESLEAIGDAYGDLRVDFEETLDDYNLALHVDKHGRTEVVGKKGEAGEDNMPEM